MYAFSNAANTNVEPNDRPSAPAPSEGRRLFEIQPYYVDDVPPPIDEEPEDVLPLRNPRHLAKRARAAFDRKAGQVQRTLQAVIDTTAPEGLDRRAADAVLDPLTPVTFEQFRREICEARDAGRPRWCCAECGQALYVCGTRSIDTHGDGRGAYFSHYSAAGCPLGVEGRTRREVNAEKFDGAQESEAHLALKGMLAQMLDADPAFRNVAVEAVMHGNVGYRKPDVSAYIHNRRIAFEVQLSTMLLPDIVAREDFYEANKTHLLWVTSSYALSRMQTLSFQAILWHNGGQIFVVDAEALAATLATGELHLQSMTVVPEIVDGIVRNVWKKRLVRRSLITFMTLSKRPRCDLDSYVKSFEREVEKAVGDCPASIREGVTGNDIIAQVGARSWWTKAVAELDIGSWDAAKADGMFEAIGVLGTIVSAKKADASRYRSTTTILDTFLRTPAGQQWTGMLVETAKTYGQLYMLTGPTTQKLIAKNMAHLSPDLGRRHGLALSMLFPKLALSRLATVPTSQGAQR